MYSEVPGVFKTLKKWGHYPKLSKGHDPFFYGSWRLGTVDLNPVVEVSTHLDVRFARLESGQCHLGYNPRVKELRALSEADKWEL